MSADELAFAPPGLPRLWLLRHGETEWSRSGQYTGLTDIPLTPGGEAQAKAAASKLRPEGFDAVLTSPLLRARRTAELVGYPDARVEPRAVEWNYGDYEGINSAVIRESNPGYLIWTDGVPNGESLESVAERADGVIDTVRGMKGAGHVLLVAHGHFLRTTAARWLGMPAVEGRHFMLGTAAVCVLGWDKRTPAIEGWNI